MPSFEELESRWHQAAPLPRDRGRIRLLVARQPDGTHAEPARAAVTRAGGLAGDRWALGPAADPGKQLTLMMARVAELLGDAALPLHLAGDNVLVDLDLSVEALPVGARLRAGTALLEVSALPHLGCAKFSARFGAGALRWVNIVDHRARRLRGVNCTVIEDGELAVGDWIERA